MYQNRATLIGTLGKAADNGSTNNPTSLAGSSNSGGDRAAGQPKRGPSKKYIPVYHVELVRDRAIQVEPRTAIHNPDDVVAILRDELLQADREKLICLMLNTKNVVIGMDIVSVGSLSASIGHPRLCSREHKRGYVLSPLMLRYPRTPLETRGKSSWNDNINFFRFSICKKAKP